MKKKHGENWQKLLGTHIHVTIYKKQCYVSSEGKTESVALIHVPLEAFCHAFNRYQRVRSALLSEMESQINLSHKRSTSRKLFRGKRSSACLPGVEMATATTASLLVTTDIERVSHPPCGHNSDVAEQAQSMIYQPG